MFHVEAQIASAAEANPSLEGATGMIATDISVDFFVYADGPAPEFLVSLGIEFPEATVIGLYGGTTEKEMRFAPTFSALDFVEGGSVIPLVELSRANTAMSFGSVLSLPIALEEMVPHLDTRTKPMNPVMTPIVDPISHGASGLVTMRDEFA